MQLVDSHCHINFDALSSDMPGLLARARDNGIGHMLCVSVNFEDYPQIQALTEQYEHIFSSVGVHPVYTDCHEPSIEELVEKATHPKVVAIGETGLDYFRADGDLDWQRERFERHMAAATITGKPLIIHTRQAADDTMTMLEQHADRDVSGVMHCFSEDWTTARRALDIGFCISFSGIVTFKNADALRDVARKTPLDRMLVETDSPYLAPVPMRGKTNEPSYVRHTAEFVAELLNMDFDALASQTTENFFRLFSCAREVTAQ
ncbi:MAG: TatD family hydrolase [Pseudomonadota bacterium]